MKTVCDWMANAPMIAPSRNWCGSRSISSRLLNVPGSDSSKFTTMYVGLPVSWGTNAHFCPVGNPAAPRPRRPLALISSMMSAGVMPTAFRSASYPPVFRYPSMDRASSFPHRAVSTRSNSGAIGAPLGFRGLFGSARGGMLLALALDRSGLLALLRGRRRLAALRGVDLGLRCGPAAPLRLGRRVAVIGGRGGADVGAGRRGPVVARGRGGLRAPVPRCCAEPAVGGSEAGQDTARGLEVGRDRSLRRGRGVARAEAFQQVE